MRKGILVLVGCMLVALLAGCGASDGTSDVTSAVQGVLNPGLSNTYLDPTETYALDKLTMKYPSGWDRTALNMENGYGYDLSPESITNERIDGSFGVVSVYATEQKHDGMRPLSDSELNMFVEVGGPSLVESLKETFESDESGITFGDADLTTRNCSTASGIYLTADITYESAHGKAYAAFLITNEINYTVMGFAIIDNAQYQEAYEKTVQQMIDSVAISGEVPLPVTS